MTKTQKLLNATCASILGLVGAGTLWGLYVYVSEPKQPEPDTDARPPEVVFVRPEAP